MILDDVQIMNQTLLATLAVLSNEEWRFWKLYLSARGHNRGWEKHH